MVILIAAIVKVYGFRPRGREPVSKSTTKQHRTIKITKHISLSAYKYIISKSILKINTYHIKTIIDID